MKRFTIILVIFATILFVGCGNQKEGQRVIFQQPDMQLPYENYHDVWQDSSLGYYIGRLGAREYLIDQDGDRISNGFHSYFCKDSVIYGALSSDTQVVVEKNGTVREGGFPYPKDLHDNYQNFRAVKCRPKESYKEVWYNKETHCCVGKNGAMEYLIDKNGNQVGSGYHSFFRKDGKIYGKIGSDTQVVVEKDGTVARYKRVDLANSVIGDGD